MLDKAKLFIDGKFKRSANANQLRALIARANEIEGDLLMASCGESQHIATGLDSPALETFMYTGTTRMFNEFLQTCQKAERLEIVARDVIDGKIHMTVSLFSKHAHLLFGLECTIYEDKSFSSRQILRR